MRQDKVVSVVVAQGGANEKQPLRAWGKLGGRGWGGRVPFPSQHDLKKARTVAVFCATAAAAAAAVLFIYLFIFLSEGSVSSAPLIKAVTAGCLQG